MSQLQRGRSVKAQNLLVFSAHAADFCSRCGGVIALHTSAGASAHVVDLTFGERGESEDYWSGSEPGSVEEVKEVRAEEARRAAAVLGATIQFLDFDDYPLEMNVGRLRRLAGILRERCPSIVLTHWKTDPYNVDHEIAASGVMRAATLAVAPGFDPSTRPVEYPQIFAFEPTVPRDDDTGFRPNYYIPIDSVFERKMDALQQLGSQKKLVEFYTQCGQARGWQARQWCGRPVRYAEAFYRHNAVVAPLLDPGPEGNA
jgi:4-oxalomesaconate hydratase